jgi:hypothetical protein
MKHFIEKVLPMEDGLGVPDEPPMKLQGVSKKYTLGTTSDLVVEHPEINSMGLENVTDAALEERMRREEVGEIWIVMQFVRHT